MAGSAGSTGWGGPGVGRMVVATYATTTATMTSGVICSPSLPSSRVASRTEVSGSRSIAQHIAPMPMPIAGARLMPGSPLIAMPSTAPTNMAGNTGPPRKALSDRPYASILHRPSTTSVATE